MINNYKAIFILGIGGTGMSSIAKYLNQQLQMHCFPVR